MKSQTVNANRAIATPKTASSSNPYEWGVCHQKVKRKGLAVYVVNLFLILRGIVDRRSLHTHHVVIQGDQLFVHIQRASPR